VKPAIAAWTSRVLAAVVFFAAGPIHASGVNPFAVLGSAGPTNWQILGINTGSSNAFLNIMYSSQVDGNVGIAKGNVNVSSSSAIYGKLDMGTGNVTNSGTISGGITENSNTAALLASATSAAMLAYGDASNMAATITNVTSINNPSSPLTITGTNGINVVNLTNLDLSGSADGLTLSAPSGGSFVINITGTFSVGNGADIMVAGGLSNMNVLYNVIGTAGNTVQFNGSSGNVDVQGIVLAPYQDININGAIVDGEVITGNLNITEVNTATVDAPEPTTLLLLATGLAGLGFRVRRRRNRDLTT
jgi:choice-of-anchor A domain-containing protein